MKKLISSLAVVILLSSMSGSALAYCANQSTSCTGNTDLSGLGNRSFQSACDSYAPDIDLNTILSKLKSSDCPNGTSDEISPESLLKSFACYIPEDSTEDATASAPVCTQEKNSNQETDCTQQSKSNQEVNQETSNDTAAVESTSVTKAAEKPAETTTENSASETCKNNDTCTQNGIEIQAQCGSQDCAVNSPCGNFLDANQSCLTKTPFDFYNALQNADAFCDNTKKTVTTTEDEPEITTTQESTPSSSNNEADVTSDSKNETAVPSNSADNLSFEQQVVALVNEQRAANGLAALTLNEELSNVARAKSQDMHDNNYFSHTSPTYGSPFDMMKSFGISYRTAGENIAMGYSTPEAVMNAWMNSEGHRANILNSSYTQIGIGYVEDGNYWTQEFIG